MNMKTKIFVILAIASVGFLSNAYGKDKESWNESRSYHFIIYYKDAPQNFIKSVEQTAEDYYQEITRNLGFIRDQSWAWDKRAKIYIYRDAEDYVESSKQAGWSHGAASALEKEIRTYPAANGFFDSILPHELGHIIFREFIGSNPYVPTWVDEGVAMYQEKAKRWGANKEVKKAIEEKKFIPLGELSTVRLYSNSEKEFVELFYAEAASIVYYLITELGEYKFVELCKQLKRGGRFENAISSTYFRFQNLSDLNDAWVTYLKR